MQDFSALSELLGGDDARIDRVLRAFRNEMSENIRLLDAAVPKGDWELVGATALRAAMACHLLGETRAGIRLETLAKAGSLSTDIPVLTRHAEGVRELLTNLMARASECVGEPRA